MHVSCTPSLELTFCFSIRPLLLGCRLSKNCFLGERNTPEAVGLTIRGLPYLADAIVQVTALSCADEVDPIAARIGALNTLVRAEDGCLKGYNTDWSAAIGAIEQGLSEQQGTAGRFSDASTAESTAAHQGEGLASASSGLGRGI